LCTTAKFNLDWQLWVRLGRPATSAVELALFYDAKFDVAVMA
jgi:hypothetical protein